MIYYRTCIFPLRSYGKRVRCFFFFRYVSNDNGRESCLISIADPIRIGRRPPIRFRILFLLPLLPFFFVCRVSTYLDSRLKRIYRLRHFNISKNLNQLETAI